MYSAPGARPRYLIVSDLPLGGYSALHDPGAQLEQAIMFALGACGFRAGRFAIGFQTCEDANVAETAAVAAMWRQYARLRGGPQRDRRDRAIQLALRAKSQSWGRPSVFRHARSESRAGLYG